MSLIPYRPHTPVNPSKLIHFAAQRKLRYHFEAKVEITFEMDLAIVRPRNVKAIESINRGH